jgi:hypothetical protein
MQAGNCQAIFKNKKEFFKKRATAFESAENERRAGKRRKSGTASTGRMTRKTGCEICKTPKIRKNSADA